MMIPERTVSATRAEFLRGLNLAFPGAVFDLGHVLQVQHGDVLMEIGLEAGGELRIAALRFPTLKVRIAFTTGSPEAQRATLDRMDLAMRRGGG